MFRKLLSALSKKDNGRIPSGLGMVDLPGSFYSSKRSTTSATFKEYVNNVFGPQMQTLGFKGKDFYYYRKQKDYTEAIFFWTYRSGGAIQCDLMIKFDQISYPDRPPVKSSDLRPDTADCSVRLSPNGEKQRNVQYAWFWIFADTPEENTKIAEDMWRVFSLRGLSWLDQFKNHKAYLEKMKPAECLDYPDFHIVSYHRIAPLYFLFEYWRQAGEKEQAKAFAQFALNLRKKEDWPSDFGSEYLQIFQAYITSN